ncbi:MAG: hypothetical protein HZB23_08645 [Deltaproteobacteria bacterium]|nr:hypothetical protein [Deltaproteobacteria bacterium]
MRLTSLVRTAVLVGLSVLAFSCAAGSGGKETARESSGAVAVMSDVELRRRLRDGFERFSLMVVATADRIKEETDDLTVRRRAVYWKTVAVPAYASMISEPNPRLALVDILTFTTAMRRSFESGQGKDLFGQFQPLALETARAAEKDARATAHALMSEKDARAVLSEVESWLAAHPVDDPYGTTALGQSAGAIRPMPESLVNAPLSTIRKWTNRLDAATEAVREITRVGDRIAQVAELSPNTGRWSMELLAYDLLQTREFGQTLASIKTLSESAAALARLGQSLPEQMRLTSESLFAEMKERETRVLAILGETRGAISEANRTLSAAQVLTHDFASGITGLGEASRDWNDTIAAGAALNRDYIEATKTMMVSSAEMRKIVDETRKVVMETRMLMDPAAFRKMSVEAEDLSKRMAFQADQLSEKIVDRIFWRAVLLMLAFFGALFAYRIFSASVLKRMENKNRGGLSDG